MPFGVNRFKHGGVTYPLDDSTDGELIELADPALFHTIELFSAVINAYVGPALLARCALENLRFPSAVVHTLHFEPTPFLLSDDLKFPLLCVYRSEDNWDQDTVAFHKDVSTWEWAYVLAPLTPRQIKKLNPLFRSISVVVSSFANSSFDPGYENGKTLRDLSGIKKMVAGPVRYGSFEAISEQSKWWKAVTGKLLVQERNDISPDAYDLFTGANMDLDLAAKGQVTVPAFVEVDTKSAPTIESISPISGTKAGGTVFQILGTGYSIGARYHVLFGGAYAASVNAVHATKLTGFAPEYEATPSSTVDIVVIDATTGQASNVLEAAYTFQTM